MAGEGYRAGEGGLGDSGGERELVAAVGRLLESRGLHLAVAESCTGGLLGHWITEVPGASAWFLGGVLAYDDRVKTGLLGVPATVIREQGAVSAACAAAMAEGVRALLGSDVALAVTGVAGPGGGTADKPVGTVYLSVVTSQGATVVRETWPGTRTENKQASAYAALALLRNTLERG